MEYLFHILIYIRIEKIVYPDSAVSVVEWQDDKNRQSWHTHCQKMDVIWEEYLAKLTEILQDRDFDLATLAKPSGPFGAALHLQWHYPVDTARADGLRFRHVLDPTNMSLIRQIKKLGTPPNVSVSDMIPIRQPAKDPD